MIKQKNFLIIAITLGIVGTIVGGITMWMAIQDLIQP